MYFKFIIFSILLAILAGCSPNTYLGLPNLPTKNWLSDKKDEKAQEKYQFYDPRGHPIIKMGQFLEFIWTNGFTVILYGGMKLTDKQWELIEPLLPATPKGPRGVKGDPLSTLNALSLKGFYGNCAVGRAGNFCQSIILPIRLVTDGCNIGERLAHLKRYSLRLQIWLWNKGNWGWRKVS